MDPDPGHAIHYSALEKGTSIYAADGERVGTVVEVLDNYQEHILDGIVFDDGSGERRFVDGPEVQRTYERAVELNISATQAKSLGPPPKRGLGRIRGNLFKRG